MSTMVREGAVSVSLEERIDRMHERDRLGAIAFVVALWFVILFVLDRHLAVADQRQHTLHPDRVGSRRAGAEHGRHRRDAAALSKVTSTSSTGST